MVLAEENSVMLIWELFELVFVVDKGRKKPQKLDLSKCLWQILIQEAVEQAEGVMGWKWRVCLCKRHKQKKKKSFNFSKGKLKSLEAALEIFSNDQDSNWLVRYWQFNRWHR